MGKPAVRFPDREELFGRLRVLREIGKTKKRFVECSCECGAVVSVSLYAVLNGNTKSCGCLKSDVTTERNYKHGMTGARGYYTWVHMIRRCTSKTNRGYPDYGGRGITVCARWMESFANFINDVGPPPSKGHSIDRYPDNNGNYEPGNVRWATDTQQNRNKRNNAIVLYGGVKRVVSEVCEEIGFSPAVALGRRLSGWDDSELFLPIGSIHHNSEVWSKIRPSVRGKIPSPEDSRLNSKESSVVALYGSGLKVSEISKLLSLSISAVTVALRLARRKTVEIDQAGGKAS